MKPDFEKMVEELAGLHPAVKVARRGLVDLLSEAYAAGYRHGQGRMRDRAAESVGGYYSIGRHQDAAATAVGGLKVEEPPT